jgi:hypothetical protein
MKLSLWQQFSGNHSSSFMIVAQFETVEWAEQVRQEIQSIVRDIYEWWEQIPEKDQHRVGEELREQRRLTPPEREFQQRYQINFWSNQAFLTWVNDEYALESISRLDRLIIINSGETWDDTHPFEEIMRKLGGRVASKLEEDDAYIVLNLWMTALDESAAERLNAYRVYDEMDDAIRFAFPGVPMISGSVRSEGTTVFIDEIDLYESYELVLPLSELPPDTSAFMRDDGMGEIDIDFAEMFQRLRAFLEAQGMTSIDYWIVQRSYL